MALFAGAPLRTIECVVVTTGAHVPVAKEGVGAGGQPRGTAESQVQGMAWQQMGSHRARGAWLVQVGMMQGAPT